MCILYVPRSRDDVHIVSTETVRNVQGNAQIHTVHGINGLILIKYECPHFAKLPVGAYRIRPEDIRMDKWTHSGVCDTPLHGMFADIQIKNANRLSKFRPLFVF